MQAELISFSNLFPYFMQHCPPLSLQNVPWPWIWTFSSSSPWNIKHKQRVRFSFWVRNRLFWSFTWIQHYLRACAARHGLNDQMTAVIRLIFFGSSVLLFRLAVYINEPWKNSGAETDFAALIVCDKKVGRICSQHQLFQLDSLLNSVFRRMQSLVLHQHFVK